MAYDNININLVAWKYTITMVHCPVNFMLLIAFTLQIQIQKTLF